MHRTLTAICLLTLLSASPPHAPAQQPTPPAWQTAAGGHLSFEVASIRPSEPGTFHPPSFAFSPDSTYRPTGGTLHADFPLSVYISFAYKLPPNPGLSKAMLATLPKWVTSQPYTIQAKAPAGAEPTKDQYRLMMQSLLAERFGLKVHFETQELPAFALTLAQPGKLGPHLTRHEDGPACDQRVKATPMNTELAIPDMMPVPCSENPTGYPLKDHSSFMATRDISLPMIALYLPTWGRDIGRPVVDQTGLTGRFDLTIQFAAQPSNPDAEVSPGPTLLEALTDQLGLRLKPIKAPFDVLIIDHVEMPSPN